MSVQRLKTILDIIVSMSQDGVLGGLKLTRETLRLGNVAARSKLKGIDGDLYKGWSMAFNSIYRAEPYQALYVGKMFFHCSVISLFFCEHY